jgi:hypothetical protein
MQDTAMRPQWPDEKLYPFQSRFGRRRDSLDTVTKTPYQRTNSPTGRTRGPLSSG